ncbi:MAG: EamA family transporter, partial [Steroidobacteraceae bacterium]
LSRVPVSIAYPLLSIGYVVNAFAAAALFGEALSVSKLAGIGLIVAGVLVLTRVSP